MNLPPKIFTHPWLTVVLIVLFVLSVDSPIFNNSFKVIYDSDIGELAKARANFEQAR